MTRIAPTGQTGQGPFPTAIVTMSRSWHWRALSQIFPGAASADFLRFSDAYFHAIATKIFFLFAPLSLDGEANEASFDTIKQFGTNRTANCKVA
jgi:hypothetical protein